MRCVCGCSCVARVGVGEPSEQPFEIVPGVFQFVPSTTQAGAHENLTTMFDFAHQESGSEAGRTDNDVRTTVVNLPAGFVASNTAVPTCTPGAVADSDGPVPGMPACPVASQVGQISFDLSLNPGPPQQFTYPIYNMEVTSFGVTAELGFKLNLFTRFLIVSGASGRSGVDGHDAPIFP